MFCSFNLTSFGKEIKRIRLLNNLTQRDISLLSGINIDTVRRIENGTVIPKYETLELLSYYYKTDLLSILKIYRSNKALFECYLDLDNLILFYDNDVIDQYKIKYEALMESNSLNTLVYDELNQFSLFLKAMKLYHNDSIQSAINILLELLQITIPSFKLFDCNHYQFSVIESRALLLIALAMVKSNQIIESTSLLMQLAVQDIICLSTQEGFKILLKIYYNISYNYHRLDSHWNSLLYANKGIILCNKNNSSYCLAAFYSRKGVAEYLLGFNVYHNSLNTSIVLFEATGHKQIANKYREVCVTKYGIEL